MIEKLFTKSEQRLIDFYLESTNGIMTINGDDIKIDTPDFTEIFHSVGGTMAFIEYNVKEMNKAI